MKKPIKHIWQFADKKFKRIVDMGKIYNGIMGLVVGDALGVPVEFRQRDTFNVTDMIGYGTHNQPPGTWSDDSSMTLATLESIGRLGRIDQEDIMENFFNWMYNGDFTAYGKTFDIGTTTQRAIERYGRGAKLQECGGRLITDNGNGALMRIIPLVFIPSSLNDINNVAGLTHAHEISLRACRLYLCVAEAILKGRTIEMALSERDLWVKEFSRMPFIRKCTRDEIKSSGYVVDTLEAAFWCTMHTNNYRECVLAAVNLGEDTDTTAAVAGGLAGILYGCGGEKGIPIEWIKQIPRKDWIQELCEMIVN